MKRIRAFKTLLQYIVSSIIILSFSYKTVFSGSIEKAIRISDKAIQAFCTGMEKREFKSFRKYITEEFSAAYTDGQFYQSFSEFHDMGRYWTPLKKADPEYAYAEYKESEKEVGLLGYIDNIIPYNRFYFEMIIEVSEEKSGINSINIYTEPSRKTSITQMDTEELSTILENIIDTLSVSLKNDDLKPFYNLTSMSFQALNSFEKMKEVFSRSIIPYGFAAEQDMNINIWTGPYMNDEANTAVNGTYVTSSGLKAFEFVFINENNDWRLFSFTFREASSLPGREELNKIIREIFTDFNRDLKKEDFSVFYNKWLTEDFISEYTVEGFTDAFDVFLENKLDLSWIGSSEITYESVPLVLDDNSLRIQAGFAKENQAIVFVLNLKKVADLFKINFINVSMR